MVYHELVLTSKEYMQVMAAMAPQCGALQTAAAARRAGDGDKSAARATYARTRPLPSGSGASEAGAGDEGSGAECASR